MTHDLALMDVYSCDCFDFEFSNIQQFYHVHRCSVYSVSTCANPKHLICKYEFNFNFLKSALMNSVAFDSVIQLIWNNNNNSHFTRWLWSEWSLQNTEYPVLWARVLRLHTALLLLKSYYWLRGAFIVFELAEPELFDRNKF